MDRSRQISSEEINSLRKKYLALIFFIIWLTMILIFFGIKFTGDFTFLYVIAVFILSLLISKIIISSFYTQYSEKIIKPILKRYGIEYTREKGVSRQLVNMSGLLPDNYDVFISRECVYGENFEAAKVVLKEKRVKANYDEGEIQENELFNGTLFIYYSKKGITIPFVIAENPSENGKLIPITLDELRKADENLPFSQLFGPSQKDEVENNAELADSLLEKLIELKNKTDFQGVSFVDMFRFVSFKGLSPVTYPSILKDITDDDIVKSLKGVLLIKVVADFFEENNL